MPQSEYSCSLIFSLLTRVLFLTPTCGSSAMCPSFVTDSRQISLLLPTCYSIFTKSGIIIQCIWFKSYLSLYHFEGEPWRNGKVATLWPLEVMSSNLGNSLLDFKVPKPHQVRASCPELPILCQFWRIIYFELAFVLFSLFFKSEVHDLVSARTT